MDDLLTLNRAAIVTRLLAGVTHEINNALLIIGGTAELLESRASRPEEVTRGAARIQVHSGRIGQTLGDLLSFARGDPALDGKVKLQATAAASVALRTYDIKRAGHTVSVLLDGPSCVVGGSGVLLQQAVLNLILNAEQALTGSRGGAITVSLERQEGYADLRVADTGPGVPAEQRARILDANAGANVRRPGAGLGLMATRRIAELHRGTLIVEDGTPGAAVVLRLPLADSGTATSAAPSGPHR